MKKLVKTMFSTLRAKIAVVIVLGAIMASGVFMYLAHHTGYRMLQKEAEAKSYAISGLGKAILEHLMLEGKNQIVQKVLRTVVSFQQIKNAFVLRSDGTIAISGDSTELGKRFRLDNFSEDRDKDGNRYFAVRENGIMYQYILNPIAKKPECSRCHPRPETNLGYFVVKISTNDLEGIALEHRTTNILMTVLSFGGLAGVTFFGLIWVVIRPVRRLHSHIENVKQQIQHLETGERTNFPTLPESGTNDEIADLTRMFNKLTNRLNEAGSTLFELHQAQLEQADRIATVGEMAASLAHEIKNPVAGVLGAIQVFDAEMNEQDHRKEVVAEMMIQLERVNQAINDLLSYARPAPPAFEEIEIHSLIEKTLTLLSQQIQGKKIEILQKFAEYDIIVHADRKTMQQLLWNIVINGLQAMGEEGTLVIKTLLENISLTIEIEDTGVGISQESLNSVFKPFFTTKHKGTGLGLAICKRIVEQHNGKITIQSQVGRGTTIRILLPAHRLS